MLWAELGAELIALVHGAGPVQLEQLDVRGLSLGAGHAAAQALLVADRVYETLRQSALKDELERAGLPAPPGRN